MSEAVTLTNCDREPIHIPGSVQHHGCLLVSDVNVARIWRHSANAAEMLGLEREINGADLHALVGGEFAHTLRNAVATAQEAARPALIFDAELANGRRFDVAIHQFKSETIIEFEPASQGRPPLQLARELIGRIAKLDSVDRLIAQSARLVRLMLGYDRVMIYRFEHDGAGKVVSEAKRGDLESFLGQYFPASDIPQQARELYRRNTIRIIADVDSGRVPIVPEHDASGEPLDLSFAHLRSVSPIHCEYLRNMGVAGSMSISILIDGELWGLIACHHYSPRTLPMAERVAAEMFGGFFSLHLQALKHKRSLETATRARRSLDHFLRLASHHDNVEELLKEHLPDLKQLMACDGIGLLMNGRWTGFGTTPPGEAIASLARFVGTLTEERIWATHALSQRFPDAERYSDLASGVLAIPLSQLPRDYLFFFRQELVQTLNWAGNPDKSYTSGPFGDRLTPRKSFAIWKETVQRQAQPWTDAEREIAEAARAATVEIVLRHNELMAEERAKADVRQRMLNEELNHRVKNILAVIKSLVGHPIQEGRSLKEYAAGLKGRIQALSNAHDQVIRGDGGGMIADLVNAELTPYRTSTSMLSITGPALWLDGRAFSVIALVLHELATNAAKYGAFSRDGGALSVAWRLQPDGSCEIVWQESGGPTVLPPSRAGFGTALIDRSIPYDLGGESDVRYAPDGVRARFVLPARHVAAVSVEEDSAAPGERAAGAAEGTFLPADLAILLVEDQMIIAMDLEISLAERGFENVTTTSSVTYALAKLDKMQPDVAILDVNLGQETSLPIAEELRRRAIPFVFATGYGEGTVIPAHLASVPVIRKPYEIDTLITALTTTLRKPEHADLRRAGRPR